MAACIVSSGQATATGTTQVGPSVWDVLLSNWGEILIALMAFIKVLVRITPWVKDDKVFGWIDELIGFIVPNLETKKKN